jgi:hypothetical protein
LDGSGGGISGRRNGGKHLAGQAKIRKSHETS